MRNGTTPSYVLITGGCGFIGANLADRLLGGGERVLLFDNLSRQGVEQNFRWLRERHGDQVQLQQADTRDEAAIATAVAHSSAVFHLAAQVAVTTSMEEPAMDFSVNAGGTLNLLEALRQRRTPPPLIFTSTNKVYGALEQIALRTLPDRYEPVSEQIRRKGIDEGQPLDFYSPYGCSKGAADQYVLDYARTFRLPAIVFRMSCIYGPRQFGTEDQGWVAHFLIRALEHRLITIYGDGRQVRDALFIDDLVDAFMAARRALPALSGQAFNIGGGPGNTLSLLELLNMIASLEHGRPRIVSDTWRCGDQRYYVSDFSKFSTATGGWRPRTGIDEGVRRLHHWLRESHQPVSPPLAVA